MTLARRSTLPGRTLLLLAALVWLLVTTLPFVFVFLTSVKSQAEIYSAPVWALPKTFDFSNYVTILRGSFFIYLRNSVFVVVVSIALTLLLSSMAAFAFARLKFRLNGLLFSLVVAGLIVPVHVTLIPIYLMTRALHLYDTPVALIGPYVAFSLPISIFILTEFMRQIPRELEESAQIDGAGPITTFIRIFLPLCTPGLATVAIYNGINMWNEFIFAYVLTSNPQSRTLPLAIWDFQGQYSANIPAILAVVTLTSLPLIVAYIFGQERIIQGMMAGSIKG
ncbi:MULTISPECIES: carbohydrate ABC transporter permease [Deinococcus]|uniref:Carbohydrate ABC transporter membrane protein 2, CUT1 family n=1 Tax=Deinococcus geothermalis (strain DSM 11300 / CIP 105573 / AG-3a) TaxID=319795 RepID=Q1J307_DEIGD|nr:MULTISPECIES: carbohydrate ABC transporter permease [Deinococcus]ABF44127.1 carbohydrate ABC transporter membrane protein 2, CUT1 family [Deinococcus geothermalis DSM 11300]MBI0446705.1 carbohydrate ABC transporter permease [Deinococcus sp. DB0503]